MKENYKRMKRSMVFKCIVIMVVVMVNNDIFAQRRGLFVHQDELNIWRMRAAGATNSNFKIFNDVAGLPNSPGDWDRISFYASQFITNRQLYRWGGPTDLRTVIVGVNGVTLTYTNAVFRDSGNEPQYPNGLGYQIRDAAFVYLVDKTKPNRQEYKNKVKEELLYYAGLQTLNFSLNEQNGSPLTYPKTYYRDLNPGFQIVNFVTKLLLAMDFIDAAHAEDGTPDWLTPDERQSLKTFFKRTADFWIEEMEWDLNRHFMNRAGASGDQLYTPAGGHNFTTGGSRFASERDGLDHRLYCYKEGSEIKEGPLVFAAMQSFNNRRAVLYRYGMLYGIKFGEPYFIDRGKQYFKDWIKYSVYANGAVGEMERWLADFPDLGWGYATDVIASCGVMAEALSRTGDHSLYNYTTRLGWESGNSINYPGDHGTVSETDKSFLLTLKFMKKIINKEVLLYGTHNVDHVERNTWFEKAGGRRKGGLYHYDTFIDGELNETTPNKKWQALHDAAWFMIFGNYFGSDADVQAMIYRTGPSMPNENKYWPAPSSQGVYPVWMGDWGIFPGVGFMFGKMINSLPTVALTSPASNSTFMAPASITLEANAADEDGAISRVEFYNGTTKLGEDVTAPYTYTWSNVPYGTYSLTAKAIDIREGYAVSSAVAVNVLFNNRLEAETNFSKVNDPNGNVGPFNCSSSILSNGKAVGIFDDNDKIAIAFSVPETGSYRLFMRVRSGDTQGTSSYWPNGYAFTVDNNIQVFSGDAASISGAASCIGTSYWGTMVSQILNLSAGQHTVTIETKRAWAAVDYLEVRSEPSAGLAGARQSQENVISESGEKVEQKGVYPIPFQDQLTVELNHQEISGGKVQSIIRDASGNMKRNIDYTIQQSKPSLQVNSLEDLPAGLYILEIHSRSSVRQVKILKE